MLIDCACCTVRGLACGDCMVTALLGPPGTERAVVSDAPIRVAGQVQLDESEHVAVQVLADAGLVPPLRLVTLRSA